MLDEALDYLRAGLQAIPAAFDKRPLGKWTELQKSLLTESQLKERFTLYNQTNQVKAIGFLTGKVSGSLEVVDVDCKYDITGNLYPDLKKLIDDNLPELASAFPIIQTRSKGYHIYYRCPTIAGNQKLARRPATAEEVEKNPKEKALVLIETRGEGGFIVAPPTPDYTMVQGSFDSIPEITPEERNCLLSVCRSFNEEPEAEPTPHATYQARTGNPSDGTSPFASYNQNGEVVSLLERHGWSIAFRQGQKVHLKRPGNSETKTSGNFHEGLRKFYVFSSSTVFEPEKAYSPADVFMLLECNNNKSEAARRLLSDGFGTPGRVKQRVDRVNTSHIRVEATDANGEETPLSDENILTEERVKSAVMDSAYIYYTAESPKLEILESLALIERTSPVRVYLVEVASLGDTTTEPLNKERPSEFKARDIMERYAEVWTANGEYMDPEREDQFIEEFIAIRQTLTDSLEVSRFRALWLQFSETNNLSITQEVIDAVEEKLRVNTLRDGQNSDFKQLIEDASKHQEKGDLKKALDLLNEKSRQINQKSKQELFAPLIRPVAEQDFAERLSRRPKNLNTKYVVKKQPLVIPVGAITVVAAPTSHGKTTFLLNLAISAADELPDKTIYVLGFEEDTDSMIVSAMSIGVGLRLSADNRGSIKSYYRGEKQFIGGGQLNKFEKAKSEFFQEYLASGRLVIQYVDYDSDTLCEFIRYLYEHGNAGGVFIDYIQLLHKGVQGGNKYGSRQLEIQQICLDLKDVSVSTNLPLVLAAQFNRSVLNPAQLLCTNIREAADIEQIANLVIGLWNNDQNHKMKAGDDDTAAMNQNSDYNYAPGQIYLEILKNRGGVVGLAQMLASDLNTGVIENYVPTKANSIF
jgi:replicative DNA helicase